MANTFTADRKPGDTVTVGDDIKGLITTVSFSYGRDLPTYRVEWFNSGALQSGEFYAEQLQDYPNG